MKRIIVVVCLLMSVSVFAEGEQADAGVTPGLITLELASGNFLNPTAGQLNEGDSSVQFCALVGAGTESFSLGQGVMAIYGLSDRIEVGGQVLYAQPDPNTSATGYGPQFRINVAEADGAIPQVAVGGVFLFDEIERQTLYAVAEKVLLEDDRGFISSLNLSVGARHFWLDTDAGDVDDSVLFAGLALGLPNHVYLIGEVSTEPDTATDQPWALGMQVRHPDGFGFTLAYTQPGAVDEASLYIGVGINFL